MKACRLIVLSLVLLLVLQACPALAASAVITGDTSVPVTFSVNTTQAGTWVRLSSAKGVADVNSSSGTYSRDGYAYDRLHGFYHVTVSGRSGYYEWVPSADPNLARYHSEWETGDSLTIEFPQAGSHTVTVTPVQAGNYRSGSLTWIDPASWWVSTYSRNVTLSNRTSTGSLSVSYVDDKGRQVRATEVMAIDSSRYIYPPDISGYNKPSAKYVVFSNGMCNPASMTFVYYPKAAPTTNLTVKYVDQNGRQLRTQDVITVNSSRYIYPQEISGYTKPSAQYVTYANGVCSPSSVTFVYRANAAPSASLTVKYVDQNGKQLHAQDVITINASRYVYAREISGYILPGAQYVSFSNGVCSPSSVTFVYYPKAASLAVKYVDQSGRQLRAQETIAIDASRYVYPPDIDGYNKPNAQYVTFNNGSCYPSSISFVYTAKPAPSAKLTVKYMDQNGKQLRSQDVISIDSSRYVYAPEIDGYILPSAQYVTFSNGSCYPSSVSFVYYPKAAPSATVKVEYMDENGKQLRSGDVYTIDSSRYIYAPDISGYNKPAPVYITFSNGTCSPSSIAFEYISQAAPTGTVDVQCLDEETGALLRQYSLPMSASGYVSGADISGYTCQTLSQYVSVNNGSCYPGTLFFYYKKNGSDPTPTPGDDAPTTLDEIRARARKPYAGSYEARAGELVALSDTNFTKLTDGMVSTYFQYTIWSSMRANSTPDVVLYYNGCDIRYVQIRGGYQENSNGFTGNARPRETRVEVHHAGGVTTGYITLRDHYRAGIEGFQTLDLGMTCTGVTQVDFYFSSFVAGRTDQNNCVITDIMCN